MPKIYKFIIENFKGIEQVEIDLENKATSPVLTLIGLNESGKTTILEALSHFVSGDKSVASLFEGSFAKASSLKLIPLHQKAAFTGKVKISGEIQLDSSDISELVEIAERHKLVFDETALLKPFMVSREFVFEDSSFKKTNNIWAIQLRTKSPRSKQYHNYIRPDTADNDLWLKIVNHIEERMQRVSYFPTFLVDMPARIYLKEHEDETALNRHYRFVFQDILDSTGGNLTLEKHVCKRILDFQTKEKNPGWLSMLFGSPEKGPIDSVFQKISSAVTKEVLGSWQRVFQRSISANSIAIEWHIDSERGYMPYATFWVSDGESRYAINERSLGFRWFFSFLLFTSFKKASERKTIFLFDEPAANLHAKAQAELLTSFSRIASDGNKIIYSTHSHHMINPRWLSSAYIVENSALDYDKADNFDLDTKPTRITATTYRQFVSQFPTRSSYFQPVIEKLEYVPPEVVGAGPYIIIEGITDYYALKIAECHMNKCFKYSLMPGAGSGASGPLISQLMGQGQRFIVLLDDDTEGQKAASKYKQEWYLNDRTVITLRTLNDNYRGKALEKLLSQETIDMVKASLGSQSKPNKKQIGWYLAEACANTDLPSNQLSASTLRDLCQILEALESLI